MTSDYTVPSSQSLEHVSSIYMRKRGGPDALIYWAGCFEFWGDGVLQLCHYGLLGLFVLHIDVCSLIVGVFIT